MQALLFLGEVMEEPTFRSCKIFASEKQLFGDDGNRNPTLIHCLVKFSRIFFPLKCLRLKEFLTVPLSSFS